MLKLKIADYFDSVVAEVDYFTEIAIKDSDEESPEAMFHNRRRQEQIDAIRRIEQACYLHVDSIKIKNDNSSLFIKYCFTLDHFGLLFVIKANKYVDSDEKSMLKEFTKWQILSNPEKLDHQAIGLATSNSSSITADFGIDFSEIFTTESAVVDLSECISHNRLNRLEIVEVEPECWLEGLVKYWRVHQVKLVFLLATGEREISVMRFIKSCMDSINQIDNLLIELTSFRQIYPDSLVYLKSLESNPRVSIYFTYSGDIRVNRPDLIEQNQSTTLNLLIQNYRLLNPVIKNRQCLESITCRSSNPSKLKDVDLTSLQFLKRIRLEFSDDIIKSMINRSSERSKILQRCRDRFKFSARQIDWSFLDPIRGNLESFELDSYPSYQLSWTIFDRMINLKELTIAEFSHTTPPFLLDARKQLFPGLINLKKLSLSVNKVDFFTTKWNCDLPMLEELSLQFYCQDMTPLVIHANAYFNLPSLVSLNLHFIRAIMDFDFSHVVSKFNQVKRLNIKHLGVNKMAKGWFREFKKLEKLELDLEDQDVLDGRIFNGMESLTHLFIVFNYEQTLHPAALHNLATLRSFTYNRRFNSSDPFDMNDQSFFCGLHSLQIIHQISSIMYSESEENVVYFPHLNRYIRVVVSV